MQEQGSTGEESRRPRRSWTRAESTLLVTEFEKAQAAAVSQRQFAKEHDVPLGTLQYWLARKAGLDAAPELVSFFESPAGLALLHRLVMAAMFQFCQVGPCGADQVGAFLQLAGLGRFLALSHGSLQLHAGEMGEEIVAFGTVQRQRLAAGMAHRSIVACADETFHPEVCLVAIEPASNFILLERYAENRVAATWTSEMTEALCDLPVDVVAVASDEGRGLVAHIQHGLGVHPAPDVFHPMRDLFKALSQPLAASLDAPAENLKAARATLALWQRNKANYRSQPRRPGRPLSYDRYIAAAQDEAHAAQVAYQGCVALADKTEAAIRSVSHAYHPVDLDTGKLRDAALVESDLTAAFEAIDAGADAIHLATKRRDLVAKARRLVPKMVATVAFWQSCIAHQLDTFTADHELHSHIRTRLIPAFYLLKVAGQAATAAERERLRATGQRLLLLARAALPDLSVDLSVAAERLAKDCANLFVRATSCVEGRNGQLALRHHSLHRLSDSRLAALTVLHNYHVRAPDGSTPAQRFFGPPHDDLFECSSGVWRKSADPPSSSSLKDLTFGRQVGGMRRTVAA